DGRKTQMRRPIKPQPFNGASDEEAIKQIGGLPAGRSLYQEINSAWQSRFIDINCPLGEPGDLLWVRETHHLSHQNKVTYRADYSSNPFSEDECGEDCSMVGEKWRPSIHMPRWASRITLEITNVRVERIQDINGDDANAEGIQSWIDSFKSRPTYHQNSNLGGYPVTAFSRMWKSIYGAEGWDQNPWVWAIEFRRVEQAKVAA
ncbi:hypothetical protein MO867_19555, partial [Microbulbifer sp. OS29]